MIRLTALAAALVSASLAMPAQAGWSNGVNLNGVSINGVKSNGVKENGTKNNGVQQHGAAAATGALLQGLTLPNGVTIAR
ncbi:hypothetical protein KTR66_17930 [Roseococcus sp. SDR]|uniref:hypothetical protein n=1 Tax=Roseococcus sp. SDR TaxID=2835532 RepID=UPI001BCB4A60|nr:hypothetical protein [Roseococcus sp. SDR]MBS7791884.1 hypothetical protein [Roseococcus sp. SDR]MBV1847198.1 hypothetical protein [Roseococcus sp. SDR]